MLVAALAIGQSGAKAVWNATTDDGGDDGNDDDNSGRFNSEDRDD